MKSAVGKISVFTLAMINVAAVLSLRNLPGQAEFGYSVVFYIVAASLLFFIPSTLVSAELASAWQQKGGVYVWVKEAFGPKWGFVAIFMQWVNNLPWFPAVFTFVASAIAYVFDPELASNKYFVLACIWIFLWLGTYLNFKGLKLSTILSSTGAMFGTIIPGIVLIVLAAIYLMKGGAPAIPFSASKLVPDLGSMSQIMLLIGMLMAMSGMEMSSVHVTDVSNPNRNFPKAVFISAAVIIVLNVLASLAIAVVVPPQSLTFNAGVLQTFANEFGMAKIDAFFHVHNLSWMTPVMAFFLAYGAVTMATTWILGPSKGLLEVADEGYLPKYWAKTNKNEMPTGILIIQASCSTVLSCVILVMPSVSTAFWIMTALTAQIYAVMYLFMFAAAIKLKFSQPDVPRPYRVFGGKPGMCIVAGLGFLSTILCFAAGFIAPSNVKPGWETFAYEAFLVCGILVFMSVPIVFYIRSKKNSAVGKAA